VSSEPAGSREAFRGRLVRVDVERWTEPDREREVVRHPGAAAIVALTEAGEVVLVRQLREAVRRRLLELPAGLLDVEGEAPAETARRELAEEAGYRAPEVRPLGRVHTSPGFADEVVHLFVAEGVVRTGRPEDRVEVVTMPLHEAVAAARIGTISDAKTVAGLLLALDR
jgi:ADP-ribose pyrophosphatase